MKTKIIIISLLAVLLGSITSCDGFLDTMPDKRAEVNSLAKGKRPFGVCLSKIFSTTDGRNDVG